MVPTPQLPREGETEEEIRQRIDDYNSISSIGGIFQSFGDAPGGFKEELQEVTVSLGVEYTYDNQFSVRTGYHHENEYKGNRRYVSFGAGYRSSGFQVDAAYLVSVAQSNPMDQTVRLSLGFDIDGLRTLFFKTMNIRVGFGYDMHRLQEGRDLWLGGVKLEFHKGLLGHSDADVLVHAICDALLGAANLRDIGFHFPDTAEEYKEINSLLLLKRTVQLLDEHDYKWAILMPPSVQSNPNSTHTFPICRKTVGDDGVQVADISIKATTSERMGFVGREEGITACSGSYPEK